MLQWPTKADKKKTASSQTSLDLKNVQNQLTAVRSYTQSHRPQSVFYLLSLLLQTRTYKSVSVKLDLCFLLLYNLLKHHLMNQIKLPTWKACDNPCLHLKLLTTISNFSRFLGQRCLCSKHAAALSGGTAVPD